MFSFLKNQVVKHRVEVIVITLLVIVVSFLSVSLFSRNVDTNKVVEDYSTKPVEWKRVSNASDVTTYMLGREEGKSRLVITCNNKRLTVGSLEAMTIVRGLENDKEYPVYNLGLDSKLYKVPVINDNPNPTQEQIEFLKVLSSANIVTYELNGTKHSWTTRNQTELSHCVDLHKDAQ